MHFGNHFGSEEKRDHEITSERYVLKRWYFFERFWCVQTYRGQRNQGAQSHQPSNP